ncbi:MAG TPA: FAD/NAD(P)-binding oxidoreductase [Acetobacteraceae bacterium]|nr:FAD/NAD(P)-binding oxidoreductase [Acetobacteraceae bacterium]
MEEPDTDHQADEAAAVAKPKAPHSGPTRSSFDIVIVGGGAGGGAAAASLRHRDKQRSIAVIEPSLRHFYQPGWTLVGGGIFNSGQTVRPMETALPRGVQWIRNSVAAFDPGQNEVILEDGSRIAYRALVVAPGLTLRWDAIDGLTETLGRNGVTSNYRFDLAPYTWQLVQTMNQGRAIFTQPAMPIKCAGAPQKALYLSADYWRRNGLLDNIEIEFRNAGGVLFGVPEFVPPLMKYIERYHAQLKFGSSLIAVDGERKVATFEVKGADGASTREERGFDMLHVVPPQSAPDFVANSPLAGEAGWVAVDQRTLQHLRFPNVFSLGDACSAPNAKTAAAVRKQAPVLAENLLAMLRGRPLSAAYDGYGACPLTVERGKVVMAEFGYGGKLMPSFPLDPTVPRRSAWHLKVSGLPWIYWNMMLRGQEVLARPASTGNKR